MSIKTKQELHLQNDNWITTNGAEEITGDIMNEHLGDIIDSFESVNQTITDVIDPTVNDDTYLIGAHWINTDTDNIFVLVDNTTGSAIWRRLLFEKGYTVETAWEKTYAELKVLKAVDKMIEAMVDLKDANELISNNYYKITNYQTTNEAGLLNNNLITYTAPVEQLVLKSQTNNSFFESAFSINRLSDIIKYNFDDNKISQEYFGGWANGDFGDRITVSNVTSTTFDINKEMILDADFYLYVEDSSNSYDFYAVDEPLHFTLTDIGSGMYRITIIDTIDLLDGDGYIEIQGNVVIANRTGYITYREDVDRNIKCSFDFIGLRNIRMKLDTTAIPTYDSGTTYNYTDLVIYNNTLYTCMSDSALGVAPSISNGYWMRLIEHVDKQYLLTDKMYFNIFDLDGDTSSFLLMPVFSTFDIYNPTTVFDLDGFKNIELLSSDVVLYRKDTYNEYEGFKVGYNVKGTTIYGNYIETASIEDNVYNVIIDGAIKNTIIKTNSFNIISLRGLYNNSFNRIETCFFDYVSDTELKRGVRNAMLKYTMLSTIGENASDIRLYDSSDTSIGDSSHMLWFTKTSNNKIGNNSKYVYSTTLYFSDNIIGEKMQYTTIGNGIYFRDNIISREFGGASESETLNINSGFHIQECEIGSNVFNYGNSSNSNFCNISFSKLGNNTRYINISNGVSNSIFENFTSGVTAYRVENVTFGRNVGGITVTNTIRNSKIGQSTFDITCDSMDSSIFGLNCSHINVVGAINKSVFGNGHTAIVSDSINMCEFKQGSFNIDATGCDLQHNVIKKGDWTVNNTCTHLQNDYDCEIVNTQGGNTKLKYINNLGVITVDDVTN